MPEFKDEKLYKDRYGSVAETGAAAGQKVICCSIRDASDEGIRYTVGRIYDVILSNGRVGVKGNGHGKKVGGGIEWHIPFSGFGAEWALYG